MKYIKDNPFLILSLAPFVGHLLLMMIVVQTQGVTPLLFSLEDLFLTKIIPALSIFGIICLGLGFKKKEDKKVLAVSIAINIFFLIYVIIQISAQIAMNNFIGN